VQKAKELRPFAEKLITLGKKDTLHARRRAATFLLKAAVVKELFDTIAARYADRNGGYTRLIKLGFRSGDGADLAIVELLGSELSVKKAEKAADEKSRKKPRKESPEADEGRSTESSEEAKENQSVAKKFSKKIKGALKGKKASKPGKATKARKDRPETT
jgi:large subunit ribosomal protein L17